MQSPPSVRLSVRLFPLHLRNRLTAGLEVRNSTRYVYMKGVAKCRKWGGLGWLGVTQGHRQFHAYSGQPRPNLRRIIETMHLSCIGFEMGVICRNLPTSTYSTCI